MCFRRAQSQKRKLMVKDAYFVNTIEHALKGDDGQRHSATATRNESDEYIEYVVRILHAACPPACAGKSSAEGDRDEIKKNGPSSGTAEKSRGLRPKGGRSTFTGGARATSGCNTRRQKKCLFCLSRKKGRLPRRRKNSGRLWRKSDYEKGRRPLYEASAQSVFTR